MLPDKNGDGVSDMAVGAPGFTFEEENGNMIKQVGFLALFNLKGNGAWKSYEFHYGCDYGYDKNDHFGCSVVPVRDINNDTRYDLAVGAYNADGGGSVTIMHRDVEKTKGACSEMNVYNHTTLTPAEIGVTLNYFGYAMASPYHFKERIFDLIIGGSSDDGEVRFLKLGSDGVIHSTWLLSAAMLGFEGNGYHIGSSVAVLPDMDGNGALEILVGMQDAYGHDGAIMILFMENGYQTVKRKTIITRSSLSRQLTSKAAFGASASLVSYDTSTVVIAVGAPKDSFRAPSSKVENSGSVVILYLSMDGSITDDYRISDLRNVEDDSNTVPMSPAKDAYFGSAVAGMEDFDGNGYHEVFVGSSGSSCCGAFTELFMEYDPTANYSFKSKAPTPQPTFYDLDEATSLGVALFVWLSVSIWACCMCCYALCRLRRRGVGNPLRLDNRENSRAASSGLSHAEIEALPTEMYTLVALDGSEEGDVEPEACSICLENFDKSDRVTRLPCNHIYHSDCIAICLRNNPLCPLCRRHVLDPFQQASREADVVVIEMSTRSNGASISSEVEVDSVIARGTEEGANQGNIAAPDTPDTPTSPSSDRLLNDNELNDMSVGLWSQATVLSGSNDTSAAITQSGSGMYYNNCDTSDEDEETAGSLSESDSSSRTVRLVTNHAM